MKSVKSRAKIAYSLWAVFIFLTASLAISPNATAVPNCLGPQPYNCYPESDIPSTDHTSYTDMTEAYAQFAWDSFLAYIFPTASATSTDPSTTNGIGYNGGHYTAVFESYMTATDMFPENGSPSPTWGTGHAVPSECGTTAPTLGKQVLDEYIQANRMGPLVDNNRAYVRFGIHFNEVMRDYIVDNRLYHLEGQEKFDKDLEWPRTNRVGKNSVFFKSAWKIMGAGDDTRKYHTVTAYVYDKKGGIFGQEPTVDEKCESKTLGLIGLHIVQRTESSPQWVWATFEHINNAPWISDFKAGTPSGTYALFDPSSCPSVNGKPGCNYNSLPDSPWNPQRTDLTPTQVVRINTPAYHAEEVNAAMHAEISSKVSSSSPWLNYYLSDVQFPTALKWRASPDNNIADVNPAYPNGLPTPDFLPNATMETYIQGYSEGDVTSNDNDVPNSDQMLASSTISPPPAVDPDSTAVHGYSGGAQRNSSSCIGCHGDATMNVGKSAGFVFSMNRARSSSPQADP